MVGQFSMPIDIMIQHRQARAGRVGDMIFTPTDNWQAIWCTSGERLIKHVFDHDRSLGTVTDAMHQTLIWCQLPQTFGKLGKTRDLLYLDRARAHGTLASILYDLAGLRVEAHDLGQLAF